jgi:urease accessory protein
VIEMTVHNRFVPTFHRPAAFLTAAAALAASPLAHAHHAMGGQLPTTFMEGMLSGIAHPVIGIDHFAFLMVAALLSFSLTGAARFLVPMAFVAATIGGTMYHVGAAELPMTEVIVALSALLGGIAVLLKRSLPALLMGVLFAVIGVFHGYAYGEAIIGAEQTPLVSYLLGFALIQYAVILGGMKLLSMLAERSERLQSLVARSGGLFATATGGLFLAMNLA